MSPESPDTLAVPLFTSKEIERQSSTLRRLVWRWVDNEDDVEDIVQDSWIAALTQARHTIQNPTAWLGVVAINLARRLRSSRVKRRYREQAAARTELMPAADEIAAWNSTRRHIGELAKALPDPYRTVLRLRYYGGYSVAEIADLPSSPTGTVKSQLKRGRALIKERLREEDSIERTWGLALLLCLPLMQPRNAMAVAVVLIGLGATWVWGPRDRGPVESVGAVAVPLPEESAEGLEEIGRVPVAFNEEETRSREVGEEQVSYARRISGRSTYDSTRLPVVDGTVWQMDRRGRGRTNVGRSRWRSHPTRCWLYPIDTAGLRAAVEWASTTRSI